MAKTQNLIYAVVGAGDFALEKAREGRKLADRKVTQKYYKDFIKRGKALTTRITSADATKQAIVQTKAARAQVKAAATSVTKAARANSQAAKSAASKAATDA